MTTEDERLERREAKRRREQRLMALSALALFFAAFFLIVALTDPGPGLRELPEPTSTTSTTK